MKPQNTAISTVPARAALAGNPSDGFGGSVLAVPIAELSATVRVRDDMAFSIRHSTGGRTHPGHGVFRLADAAVRRFGTTVGRTVGPVAIDWSTSIPRSVGLAGSSALVIAVLEALSELVGTEVDPIERAAMALAVEGDDLGIAAGPQDRVVQALGTPLLMRFDESGPFGMGHHEAVEGDLLSELYVAWSVDGAAPSGELHDRLRTRWSEVDPYDEMRSGMADVASTAVAAVDALRADDRVGFDSAIDESLRLRAALVGVDDTTMRLADAAASVGVSANTAGSGGAVAGRCDPDRFGALAVAIDAVGGEILSVTGLARST